MTAEELYEKLMEVFLSCDDALVALKATETFYATVLGGYRDMTGLNMIEQSFRNVRAVVDATAP